MRVRVSFEIERDTIDVGSSYRALGGVVDAAVGGVLSTGNNLWVENWETVVNKERGKLLPGRPSL